jgi:nitrous oxidase accessory protein NosD
VLVEARPCRRAYALRLHRAIALAALPLLALVLVAGCDSKKAANNSSGGIVRVPADANTISAAMAKVHAGGMVLVSPGTYKESVTIDKKDVTLRGTDRNAVIIDGELIRPEGVLVIADGARVENLTVKSHTFNGVLVTGLHDKNGASAHGVDGYQKLDPTKFPPIQRFSISHVTAYDNGLYGIYAFDSRHGVIADNYASGSADSGFYVGQCTQCDIVVRDNVAERNAVGFENANASDSVLITGNRFAGNRVGMTLISNYQEAFIPQQGNTVVGNLIANNVSADSPAQADGGFGIGLGISGGQGNTVQRNLIVGNLKVGVQLVGAEDIPAKGNQFTANQFSGNGVDVADTSVARTPSVGNCLSGNQLTTVVPPALAAATCPAGTASGIGVPASQLPSVPVPPGMSFAKVPAPPSQPSMTGSLTAMPAVLPGAPVRPDPATVALPTAALLADRAALK